MHPPSALRSPLLLFGAVLLLASATLLSAAPREGGSSKRDAGRSLGFVDLMKMRTVAGPVISDDGRFVAYEARADRGDGLVEVVSTDGKHRFEIERGTEPALSADGRHAAALVKPTAAEQHAAKDEKDEAKKPKNGLVLVATADGRTTAYENVEAFAFSEDGRWLVVHHGEEAEEPEDTGDGGGEEGAEGEPESGAQPEPREEPAEASSQAAGETAPEPGETPAGQGELDSEEDEETERREGTRLLLRRLADGSELELENVESFALAHTSGHLAYAVASADGVNSLRVQALAGGDLPEVLEAAAHQDGRYTALAWARDSADLAFVAAVDGEGGGADDEPGDGTVWIFHGASGEARAVATGKAAPEGWHVPSKNELTWSDDGERLYYGTRPRPEPDSEAEEDADAPHDPFDTEAILAEAGVDVWHVDDPLIKTNEREEWKKEKDRTYLAVYHRDSGRSVQLATTEMREIELRVEETTADGGGRAVVGRADVPYLKERTWAGFFRDLYWVPLDGSEARRVARRLPGASPSLSPDGRYLAFYEEPHWHLYDADTDSVRNLTEGLAVPFSDEDDDYPAPDPGYGTPEWVADGSSVLLYDKYDLWRVPVSGGAPERLTRGREEQLELRIVDLDPESTAVDPAGMLLLEGYRHDRKNDGFWHLDLGTPGAEPEKLLEAEKRFAVRAKAKDADLLLYDRQSYREFPDLWVAGPSFEKARKLTDVNPQISDFAWGRAELVEWRSEDGLPLQGVLIRPDSLDAAALERGERCPVLTYFYRFFSQRLHLFNEPKVNHRPSFPVYASHGYCVFLPDVRFEVGRPGLAAMKSVVPGVQKLVEMGVADPDRLGLHGHSWSGYTTAFIVTQSHIFAAAVAGAPVSNMTSAYGGIRYGTGLARLFQYEKSQSRLGVSLWEGRDRYIENSPLFYADRVETPLLLMFGDVDEAVPWTQGIELYLALRRLGKEAVFLEYHDEPHHLKQYGNKLDYSIKMKEFFDHHLQGVPAPAWWTEGVPYEGEE
ncbi:MAG: prolyl oligopeptidase family serine peptidase [Holophagales bacterium]|nr:prolyl oligopeptidase family serine peptidase [Holophagales bacterium]